MHLYMQRRERLLQILLNTMKAPFNFLFSDGDFKCTIRKNRQKPCIKHIQELKRAFGHLKKQNVIALNTIKDACFDIL